MTVAEARKIAKDGLSQVYRKLMKHKKSPKFQISSTGILVSLLGRTICSADSNHFQNKGTC